jgi:hypothetical protein
MEQSLNQERPRRREYSPQLKAEILALCAQPGASVGGVALAHGLHSNMVHRWIREIFGVAFQLALHVFCVPSPGLRQTTGSSSFPGADVAFPTQSTGPLATRAGTPTRVQIA